jgi:hypothetical protein
MTPITWKQETTHASDRIEEQFHAEEGSLNLWIESHKIDERGQYYAFPKWVFWWYFTATPSDVYVHGEDFPTKDAALGAAQRFLAMVNTLAEVETEQVAG